MFKSEFSTQKLFWPYAWLLSFAAAASFVSLHLSQLIRPSVSPFNIDLFTLDQTAQISSIVLAAISILLFGTVPFKSIFKSSLVLSALGMLLSIYFPMDTSTIAYFFTAFFLPKVLFVLAWAYINQLTNKDEGIKAYFALFLASELIGGAICGILSAMYICTSQSTAVPIAINASLLAWSGVACLGFMWACDRMIQRRIQISEEMETTQLEQNEWLAAFCLAMIASGLKIASTLSFPKYIEHVRNQLVSANIDPNMLALCLASISCCLLGLFVGPKLIAKKGWKLTVLIAPAIAFLAVIFAFFNETIVWARSINPILFTTLSYYWIFPLVQISFLSYAKRGRFSLQAWVYLVMAPLIFLGVELIHLEQITAPISTCILLALMTGSTVALAKPK